jgi:hypothetical protein
MRRFLGAVLSWAGSILRNHSIVKVSHLLPGQLERSGKEFEALYFKKPRFCSRFIFQTSAAQVSLSFSGACDMR